MTPLTHLDLFSGIGGFALAARMAGNIKTVAFCEREAYAQRVLKKHWPDLPICDDIHHLKGNDYGPIDLVTGGFPCQPYSLAGERRGNDDDRALWPQMLRVIREARPTWVLGENVPGIISLALDGVLADLEGEGYACESLLIPACGVDAKHRRERIWIVAHREGIGRGEGRARGSDPSCQGEREQALQTLADDLRTEIVRNDAGGLLDESAGSGQAVADANGISGGTGAGRKDRAEAGNDRQATANAHQARRQQQRWNRSNGEECATVECGSRWLPEPDVGRVAHGIPSRVDRLKGLGNAIVPQVAAVLLSKIVEVHYGHKAES